MTFLTQTGTYQALYIPALVIDSDSQATILNSMSPSDPLSRNVSRLNPDDSNACSHGYEMPQWKSVAQTFLFPFVFYLLRCILQFPPVPLTDTSNKSSLTTLTQVVGSLSTSPLSRLIGDRDEKDSGDTALVHRLQKFQLRYCYSSISIYRRVNGVRKQCVKIWTAVSWDGTRNASRQCEEGSAGRSNICATFNYFSVKWRSASSNKHRSSVSNTSRDSVDCGGLNVRSQLHATLDIR